MFEFWTRRQNKKKQLKLEGIVRLVTRCDFSTLQTAMQKNGVSWEDMKKFRGTVRGECMLHHLVKNPNTQILDYFLRVLKMSPDIEEELSGEFIRPLYIAGKYLNVSAIKLLVTYGAQVNYETREGLPFKMINYLGWCHGFKMTPELEAFLKKAANRRILPADRSSPDISDVQDDCSERRPLLST